MLGAPEGFVEYLKLTEKGLYPIPDGIETHVAALVQPYACSVSAVRRSGLVGGETVVVLGAGVLGLCAAGAAKALGAGRVIMTAKHPQQQALARTFGADVVVTSSAPDVVEQLVAATGGGGADLVVRPAGTIAVLGLWDNLVPVDSWKSVLKEISYRFFLNHGVVGRKADYQLCLDWMASRTVPAQDLVTHTVRLEEIAEGFRLAHDKRSGAVKVIVRP
jgi:threonine dehydrogenase-like Zn-dependent dehydrogenase